MADKIQENVAVEEEESAFDDAVKELFENEEGTNDTSDEDTNDSETAEDDNNTPEDAEEPASDDTDNDGEPSQASVDYKALYDQAAAANAAMQADYEQKLSSWEGRIEAARQEALASVQPKAETTVEKDEELEEILDLYPDLIPQVQKIIDNKVSTEVSGVEARVAQLIEQQVGPVAARVKESEAQAHEDAILRAHPDIRELVATGQFRQWVETLPQYQQMGAQQICDSGSADQVIDLFNNFKESTNKGAALNKSPNKEKAQPTKSAGTVDKLKAAMSVPSEPPKVSDGEAGTPGTEDLNKLFAQATQAVMKEDAF